MAGNKLPKNNNLVVKPNTRGRPKGAPNKTTAAIKDMILGALGELGGQVYLVEQAIANPVAFMGLMAKVMPTQITGADDGPLAITIIERRIVDPVN